MEVYGGIAITMCPNATAHAAHVVHYGFMGWRKRKCDGLTELEEEILKPRSAGTFTYKKHKHSLRFRPDGVDHMEFKCGCGYIVNIYRDNYQIFTRFSFPKRDGKNFCGLKEIHSPHRLYYASDGKTALDCNGVGWSELVYRNGPLGKWQ